MDKTVEVKYQTRKEYCSCCNQKLLEPRISEIREFVFTKDNCLEWLSQEGWETTVKYDDELQMVVEEFVRDTIDFFATSSYELIIIENSELEKVKKFVLEEVC